MAQFEIDLPESDIAAFDRIFWDFCGEYEGADCALEMTSTARRLRDGERRTIWFADLTQALRFQRNWWCYLDSVQAVPRKNGLLRV